MRCAAHKLQFAQQRILVLNIPSVFSIFKDMESSTPQQTQTQTPVTTKDAPVRVWWTNLGFYSQQEFDNLYSALAYAKRCGFDACFDHGSRRLGSWSIFGGFRRMDWSIN